MNRHSSRIRGINDIRRRRNQSEREIIIPEVIGQVIDSTNRQTSNLMDYGEFPINFYYPLSKAVERIQKRMGMAPYKLRNSKLHEIIALLEGPYAKYLLAPIADTFTHPNGDIDLDMLRA